MRRTWLALMGAAERAYRDEGGHKNEQNPADPYENPYTGKSIPIDVALNKVDTLDLNASYAGTIPLWYRLLNCGFHLPASAGTDTFLNRIASRLPGGDRVYVKLNGPLTYDNWITNLKAGRSFVSNGPLIEFTAENSEPGDTLKLETARTVHIRATAKSLKSPKAAAVGRSHEALANRCKTSLWCSI